MQQSKSNQNVQTKLIIAISTRQIALGEEIKLKNELLLYYWFIKENDAFYHQILNVKNKSVKLQYYIQFIKLNFLRKIKEIELGQKHQLFSIASQSSIIEQILPKSLFRDKILKYVDVRFKNLSTLEKQNLNLIKKSTINQFLSTKNKGQDDMEQIIALFVKFEEHNELIIERLSKAVSLKLQYQNSITVKNAKTLFNSSFEIVRELFQIEQQLISYYNLFPSKKIQTYLIFYFAEIQNDILGAYYFSNVNAMTEGNLIKLTMKMNQSYDIINENIEYLTLSLDESTYTFNIEKYSKGLANTLFEENQQNTLNDILPLGLQSIHVEYIERFLLTGTSKYFRQFSKAFYRGRNKYICQIDAVVDFLQSYSDPSYIVFIKQIQIKYPHIWVDKDFNISGITEDLSDLFSLPKRYHLQFQENIDMKPIQQLIPNFKELILNQSNEQVPCLTELRILGLLKDIHGVEIISFICEMIIHIRTSPSDIKYFIIEILSCKSNIQGQQDLEDDIINEEPIKYRQPQQQYIFNTKMIQSTYWFCDTNIQFSLINSPRSDKNMILYQDRNQDFVKCNQQQQLQEQNQNELGIQESIKDQYENSHIVQVEEVRSQNLAMNGFGLESQASSIAGIRSTKYYKRYLIIHRYMNGNTSQSEIKIIFMLLGLIVLLGAIQAALYLSLISNDLKLIEQNIEVLTLKTSFSGAQDSYLICINSIAYHFIQLGAKQISQTQYNEQIKYPAYRLANIFGELKSSYQNFIQNPSLSTFLVDKHMVVNQKNGTNIVQINTTINEAFVLYIESSFGYQSMVTKDSYQLDLQAAYIVFQISNYRVFKDKIELIHDAMVQTSLNKSSGFYDKINYLFYPNISASIIIMVISLHYFIAILKKMERLSKLFNNNFITYLKLEKQRLINLNSFINYETLNYQEYKLDVFENESELNKLEDYFLQCQSNRSLLKLNQQFFIKKTFIIKYISLLIAFLLFYSSFQLINYIQFILYVQKLPNTIQYYDQMVELHSSSSSLYISKQLTSQISGGLWYFLNETSKQQAQKSYNDSLKQIQNYLSSYQHIDTDQLLVSQNYINRYNSFINENLCQQIEQSQLVEWFCIQYIGGSLKRGFITAISAIIYEFQNQYEETKKFSLQTITNQSSLEGGLILGSIIKQLCEIINQDMLENTQSLTTQIVFISASYLLFFLPFCFFILYHAKKRIDKQFKISLRIITLLPQSFLYLDNQIDGELRSMAIQFQI